MPTLNNSNSKQPYSQTSATHGNKAAEQHATLAKDEPASPPLADEKASTDRENADTKPSLSKLRLIAITVTLAGASFLNTLSVQAAVIVLPTISRDLNIPLARQQWVISAYSLAFACFLLVWARMADVYGRRTIFLFGSVVVAISTLLVPWMPTEISFDIFRGLQGFGAAANTPTAIGIIGATFPPGQAKIYAISCYSAGFPLGSVIGNILGGLVGQYATWKWVFWVLAILASLVVIAAFFVVPTTAPLKNLTIHAIDWFGAFLITVALIMLMFVLTEGNVVGWSTPWVPVLIVVSVALIVGFCFWQHHLERRADPQRPPLMKLSIWQNGRFACAQIAMLCFFGSFNTFLVYATYFYQDYQHLSVIQTTLRFIPTGVVGLATAFVSSQILSRVPGVFILAFGTACMAVAALLFAVGIPPHETYWAWGFPAMCLSVFGADTVYPCLTLFTVQSLPPENQAMGGGIINAVGQLGRALSLAIAVAIQTAVNEAHESEGADAATLRGYHAVEWFNFATAVVASLVAVLAFRGAGKVGKRH